MNVQPQLPSSAAFFTLWGLAFVHRSRLDGLRTLSEATRGRWRSATCNLGGPLVNSYIHVPTPRRAHAPSTPIDLALIRLLRSAMDLDWTPRRGVPAVLDAVGGSSRLLRQARVRLLRRLPDY